MTAQEFIETLKDHRSPEELNKVDKFFKGDDDQTKALGVKFGTVFKVAKEFKSLPLDEISSLLDSEFYEVRMGAVSIMDFQARDKKLPETRRKELFELYLQRHDRINNWDLVDRAAYNVIGRYLADKSRELLDELARSQNVWERRTALVATYHFIKQGDLEDTFRVAEILLQDQHELINRAVGSWIREAGKRDPDKLMAF